MELIEPIRKQITDTYRRMAREANFGPVNMQESYAEKWWEDEDDGTYFLGSCVRETRPATIFAMEAARSMCNGQNRVALALLRMAVADLETLVPPSSEPP